MLFLEVQQAPEPRWNTTARINSDADSALPSKSDRSVLYWWARIITILVAFSVIWKGLCIMIAFYEIQIFASRYGKIRLQQNWGFSLNKEHSTLGKRKWSHYPLGLKDPVVLMYHLCLS